MAIRDWNNLSMPHNILAESETESLFGMIDWFTSFRKITSYQMCASERRAKQGIAWQGDSDSDTDSDTVIPIVYCQ